MSFEEKTSHVMPHGATVFDFVGTLERTLKIKFGCFYVKPAGTYGYH
jgi:hypothetical protein